MFKENFMGVIPGINEMLSSLQNWAQWNKEAAEETELNKKELKHIKNGVDNSPQVWEGLGNWLVEVTRKNCPKLFQQILKLYPPSDADYMEVDVESETSEKENICALRAFKAKRCMEEDRLMYYQTCYMSTTTGCKRKFPRLVMTSFETNEQSRSAFFETYYKPVKRRTLLAHQVSARKRTIAELVLGSFGADDEGKQAFCDVYYSSFKKSKH